MAKYNKKIISDGVYEYCVECGEVTSSCACQYGKLEEGAWYPIIERHDESNSPIPLMFCVTGFKTEGYYISFDEARVIGEKLEFKGLS